MMATWNWKRMLAASALVGAIGGGGAAAADHPPNSAAAALRGDDEGGDPLRKLSVVGRAATFDNLGVLTRALVVSGLNDVLRNDGPFTLFAPTDEAFARLGPAASDLFKPENKAKLVEILKYHVVPARILAAQLSAKSEPKTVGGRTLTVVANDRGVAINDATVVKADIPCRNGVIHVIDRVLSPGQDALLDVATKAGRFEKLLAAVRAAGLADDLGADGPFTLLAPTDEAFDKLGARKLKSLLQPENKAALAEVLKYHVIPGRVTARQAVASGEAKTLQGARVEVKIADGRLEIGGARVAATDLAASNGIIHVIDSVLVPPER